MITRRPDYYDSFECLGGPCPDNCCIGDELVLDEDTYRLYMAVPGAFGDRLRAVLSEAERVEDEGLCEYCLDVDGRCPFLNEENYCDIVLALGGDVLGEVCSSFPRTEDRFAGALERNLMIACPEAACLLLTHDGPVRFIEMNEEEPAAEPDGDIAAEEIAVEEDLLRFRGSLLDILADRHDPLADRLQKTAELCGLPGIILPGLEDSLTILSDLPWRHRVWPEAFDGLKTYLSGPIDKDPPEFPLIPDLSEDAEEHLLTYFIFRCLPWAEDVSDTAAPLLLAVFSVIVIGMLTQAIAADKAKTPALADLIKASSIWSKELEFSEENILYLFDTMTTTF